ncbi:MAG TPA: fenitrothion hydrolase [Solirubrobacteraceae bacterium]|nr:fenitrothion hydrolase [Solirubrobacteraceae bacterium]
MHRRRLLALLVFAGGAMLLAAPDSALAHGLVGRQDLPIPKWLFAWGAAAVLVASFAGLAVLWPRPRLEGTSERRLAGVPRFLDPLAGALGVVIFVLVIYAGFAGSQTTTNNLAPTVIFVLFWVGIPIASLFFGDVFKALNPWRAVARAVAWLVTKAGRGGLPAPMAYPAKVGRWPAAIAILAFAWVELVYSGRGDPSNLAVLALVYVAVQFVGMSLYGIGAWNRYGDGFGVYFGLIARMAPLRWSRPALFARKPLSGLTNLDVVPGTVALILLIIGTTSFDGFSGGPTWGNIAPELTNVFRVIGFGQATALELVFTLGLVAVTLIVAALYRLGVMGMQTISPQGPAAPELAARFAHSLVPIGLAYVVAHYFSLLAYEGQRMAYLISDPLGDGSNIFGTSSATVDYTWISATAIWYVQVAALVIGHVAGLVLAHERALVCFDGDSQVATRSQYWMLIVMIAFTSLGLWLLSAANS